VFCQWQNLQIHIFDALPEKRCVSQDFNLGFCSIGMSGEASLKPSASRKPDCGSLRPGSLDGRPEPGPAVEQAFPVFSRLLICKTVKQAMVLGLIGRISHIKRGTLDMPEIIHGKLLLTGTALFVKTAYDFSYAFQGILYTI
jgi:hypothetical protein